MNENFSNVKIIVLNSTT